MVVGKSRGAKVPWKGAERVRGWRKWRALEGVREGPAVQSVSAPEGLGFQESEIQGLGPPKFLREVLRISGSLQCRVRSRAAHVPESGEGRLSPW